MDKQTKIKFKRTLTARATIKKTIYIGFMRLVTLNFKKWCKPTNEGWKRR